MKKVEENKYWWKNMTERERIGQRIAEIRKEKGISQRDLSELSGVTYANISRIELGKYSPTFDTLQKIGDAFGLKCDIV